MLRVGITDHPFGNTQEIERTVLGPLGVELTLASATDEVTLVELASSSNGLLVCYAPVTRPVVEALFGLIRFRNTHPAFAGEFRLLPSADHESP